MKILIAVDMEGISGVTNWNQVDPAHAEYPRFRRIMTQDVNAAIRGAFEAGASEVIVADGHANGTNILIEELDPRAHLHSNNAAPFSMVQGIDESVQGVFFIGYHARAGTVNAIMDHTWSSRRVHNLWLNGVLTGEYGLNAALCGHFGAPVVMVSGDQAACAQAAELLGSIEQAVVKRATSRFSAECLPLVKAQEEIYEAAVRAIHRLKARRLAPFHLETPVRVTVEYASSDMADAVAHLPGSHRLDGRRVEWLAPDMPAAYLTFDAAVQAALT